MSARLHLWIDLIWGNKQRGALAEKFHNKFYYLTYEDSVDIKAIKDKGQLDGIKNQINEFGQTPTQLFSESHPPKYSELPAMVPVEAEAEAEAEHTVDCGYTLCLCLEARLV